MEMPLKKGDLAIFYQIGWASGSASKNRETHYLWGRVDRYAISQLLKPSNGDKSGRSMKRNQVAISKQNMAFSHSNVP